MRVDSLGYTADIRQNQITNDAKSSSGFAASLDDALSQIAENGTYLSAQRGTAAHGFSYVVPVMKEFDKGEDASYSNNPLKDTLYAEELEPGSSGSITSFDPALIQSQYSAYNGTLYPASGAAMQAMQSDAAVRTIIGSANPRARSNRAIIDSFNVENNPKYRPNQKGTGDTYCNLYVADVTKALNAPVPRRINADTGEPITGDIPKQTRVSYLNANRMNNWLNSHGRKYGWIEVDPPTAQKMANNGNVAVATWKNPSGASGHIQVVSPSKDDSYDPKLGVAIAQAGTKVINYGYIEDVYKTSTLQQVQYFANIGAV